MTDSDFEPAVLRARVTAWAESPEGRDALAEALRLADVTRAQVREVLALDHATLSLPMTI